MSLDNILYITYLIIPSGAWIIQGRMFGCLTNDKSDPMEGSRHDLFQVTIPEIALSRMRKSTRVEIQTEDL
jgi:hypothetical protein